MGEKKDLVRRYMAQGLRRDRALAICGISKNQFYHQPKTGKRGRKPSTTTTQLIDNELVVKDNAVVQSEIKAVYEDPKIDYGYHKMTGLLQLRGYYINHKKVYRLMKAARLLRVQPAKTTKNYVQYRILCPEAPLRLMEMDIKQVWVNGASRQAYIFTIIDVLTRVVLYWEVDFKMKQGQIQAAWEQVIENHLQPAQTLGWEVHIEVRSDNGPQFCAKKLSAFLKKNQLVQTFTHPYTPQENGHVESFHAILGRDLSRKYFENLADLRENLEEFYYFYNYERIHNSTLKLPPILFWEQWNKGNIERIVLDEQKRRVKFKLKVPRQNLLAEPAGIRHSEVGLLLDLEGSIPDQSKSSKKMNSISEITQKDGAVLIAQPAVQ